MTNLCRTRSPSREGWRKLAAGKTTSASPRRTVGTESWTAADVSPNNVVPYDLAATRLVDATPKGNLGSLTLSLEQQLGARVTGFVDALYSENKNVARYGVEVITVEYDEVHKYGGGIRCNTMQLIRDPGPTTFG